MDGQNNKTKADDVGFLEDVTKMMLRSDIIGNAATIKEKHRVIDFRQPEELKKFMDFDVQEEPADRKSLLKFCEDFVRYSLKTSHPLFLSRLYHGVDGYGLAGAWLSEALNTTQTTYEVASVFTLLERALLDHLRRLIGWETGDGIFCPGGSLANMYGMALARYKLFPSVKEKGVRYLPPLVTFVSDEGHYSIVKGQNFLGMGTETVVRVKTDSLGRMIPGELEAAILEAKRKGNKPYFVCATAGTTVLGAYDPLSPLADVCQRHGLWLHVDAAWGGAAAFSEKHRHLLDGIDRVDSVTWDLHKMPGVPLQCSVYLSKHKGMLYGCNGFSAEYLFQPDKYYDVTYDVGDESIQCGRKVDSLKLWLVWKGRGSRGMEKLVDNAFAMAEYLADRLRETEGFRLVLPRFECTNVCFWFVPPCLRGREDSPEFWSKMAKVAPAIKKKMVLEGSLIIDYHPLGSKSYVNFFRVPLHCTPPPSRSDMDFIVREISRLGNEVVV
ncbi:cysteine sulfinic acid decarboxylase-like [Centruroides sculpturatus]|uniref:cysteine sulfinic acid decarboxylase-like n=1 Tax=Centruroides sculpturatus TaxID=218467 RepID=UPI000C6E6C7F|nr:cysteine sulfinic acid decarboxylase-like [Centruroides sculpturatus]